VVVRHLQRRHRGCNCKQMTTRDSRAMRSPYIP
jgi:hypothetical protein